jgi:hypothetical protein
MLSQERFQSIKIGQLTALNVVSHTTMKKQAVLCELEQIEYHQDGGVAKEKDSQ